MEVKDLSKYSDAEFFFLAEQLWDSVSKKDLEISEDIKKELDVRIQNLEEGKAGLYSWDEVKSHLKSM
ncbi:addiction module protein [Flavobacterium flavigenum]|uniref:addiction module protein n=1 Tax=Flavobacterium flavigenum TaxID=3003258 RepID=UPI002482F31A|nr:addiction module protein [Flavobacterium flavigenum]